MAAVQRRRLLSAVALAVMVCGLSLLVVALRPAGTDAALWWPASGVAVAWILRGGRPDRLLLLAVAVGTLGVAYVAGRPPLLAAAFVLANCVEVFVVTWYVTRGRQGPFRFRRVADVGTFLMAVVLGCAAGAVVAAAGVGLAAGSTVPAWRFVAFAHAAAILLVAPVVLTPAPAVRRSAPARAELLLQWAGLLAVTLAVFAPRQGLPLAFLCLPVVVWTAVRSGARATAWQLLVLGVLVSATSAAGWGPFAAALVDPQTVVGVAHVFTLACSSATLVLAVGATEHQRSSRLVAEREALYRNGFQDALVGMLLVAARSGSLRVLEVNAVAARLLGSTPEALVGTDLSRHVHGDDVADFEAGALDVAAGNAPAWRGEVRLTGRAGDRWVEVAVAPSRDRRSDPVLSLQMVDVTERHEAHAHLRRLALHDPLTGLPNRSLLLDRLEHALAAAGRTRTLVGVAYIDLDGFKAVNDVGGHDTGDLVLVDAARRLQAVVRPGDTLARVGGDEFVLLCPSVEGEADVHGVLDRMATAMAEPVAVGGVPYRVSASHGVVTGGEGAAAAALLRAADERMYAEKRRRRPLSTTGA